MWNQQIYIHVWTMASIIYNMSEKQMHANLQLRYPLYTIYIMHSASVLAMCTIDTGVSCGCHLVSCR